MIRLMLQDAHTNLSALCGPAITIDGAIPLTDGETISLESDPSFCLKVMHTPGHTPDSVTFYSERDKVAFVGDTIFKAGIGSWGYPGGNKTNLIKSIMERIFALPDETVLCSGHSEQTTIGTERVYQCSHIGRSVLLNQQRGEQRPAGQPEKRILNDIEASAL